MERGGTRPVFEIKGQKLAALTSTGGRLESGSREVYAKTVNIWGRAKGMERERYEGFVQ